MTEEQLIQRTIKYNRQAAQNLSAYRRKVIALFYLGLALTLLFCLPFIALLVFALERCAQHLIPGLFLFAISLLILSRIVRPLLATINETADNIALQPKQSPALFRLVEEISTELNLNNNLQINLHKQLSISGTSDKKQTILNLGLPLLQTLTPDQFRSIVTNELIHIRNGNERLQSTMSLRLQRWSNLRDSLNGSLLGSLSAPFFKHILPWLDLHTYPLYCHNVLHNDTETTRFCPPEELAAALCNLHAAAAYLEADFWHQFTYQSRQYKRPPKMPFHAYPACLEPASLKNHLEAALNVPHYVHNPRPTLQNRLRNLRLAPRLDFPQPEQSAAKLLGDTLQQAMQQFNQEWWQGETDQSWQKAYDSHQERLTRLQTLNDMAEEHTLPEKEALERAMLTEHAANDPQSALMQLAELHRLHPDSAQVCLEYGRMLLDKHDGDGVPVIRRAGELDNMLTIQAATIERDYHAKHDRNDAAAYCQKIIDHRLNEDEQAQAERTYCTPEDLLEPAQIPANELAEFQAYLQTIDGLDKVYLVQKTVRYRKHQPIYIIAFTVRTRLWQSKTAAIIRITEQLTAAPFPHEAFIITLSGEFKSMHPRITQMKNARII
ncbi:MAG: hypothetical protein Q4A84_10255 [Neisseria sp.]|uniref:hypothetical protein n=1 Tax=Neisseria sp. TaxID=192066 RepID=UPI0026DCAF5A|nr:hypothetical protein [Neisseria sp.]MDO4642058.1 hypothetical protein [Neisseria sp.]